MSLHQSYVLNCYDWVGKEFHFGVVLACLVGQIYEILREYNNDNNFNE